MDIAIVGRGRLGRSLGLLLVGVGHTVTMHGRGDVVPPASVRMLTVPDAQIASLAASIPVGDGVMLHCAGSLPHQVLRPHPLAGSLHPLMTFPGPEVDLPDLTGVPAAVAGDPEAADLARQLAIDLGMTPFDVLGDRRLYHAAAVLAGNLSMVLVAEAGEVLRAAGVHSHLARHVLIPLALRSVGNADRPLAQAMTGPVARGDVETIRGHRAALDEHGLTRVRALYDQLVTIAELHLGVREAEEDHTG